jgi:protein phosphatase
VTTFRVGAATDTGRVRSNNQDSNLVGTNLYAVADGMGGHQGGEVASAIAVETLQEEVTEPTAGSLVEGVRLANQAIFERQADTPELRGMGTTLCAVALVETEDGGEEILVVNVGDSRVYRFRDDVLSQVTRDHSLVEDLRREGRLTDAEAAVHPHRNVLTRALGIDANVVVDEFHLEPHAGDRFLLCSDGLFNEVPEDRISATLRRLESPDDAAHELVRQANENGGRDNITCVVVDVVDAPPARARRRRAEKPLEAAVITAEPPPAEPARAAGDDDLAGFTQPVPELAEGAARGESTDAAARDGDGAGERPDTGDTHTTAARAGAVAAGEPQTKIRRRRRFTWRVAVFLIAFLVVVAAAAVVIIWQGRGTYYVAFNDAGELVVNQGTPGGLLGINPTLYRTCPGLTTTNVPTTLRVQIQGQKTFSTFPDARDDAMAYVSRVAKQAGSTCDGPAGSSQPGSGSSGSPTSTTLQLGAVQPGATTSAPARPAPGLP